MVQAEQETSVETAIERMVGFSRAMVAGDADALDEMLAPDFTYTHMGGRVEPRGELVESVRNGRHNDRMDFEGMAVRAYPGATIVNGLNHMRIDYPDRPSLAFDAHFTGVWVDVGGASKLVVYHSTRVPEE